MMMMMMPDKCHFFPSYLFVRMRKKEPINPLIKIAHARVLKAKLHWREKRDLMKMKMAIKLQ